MFYLCLHNTKQFKKSEILRFCKAKLSGCLIYILKVGSVYSKQKISKM
jgi:hypothetical protein